MKTPRVASNDNVFVDRKDERSLARPPQPNWPRTGASHSHQFGERIQRIEGAVAMKLLSDNPKAHPSEGPKDPKPRAVQRGSARGVVGLTSRLEGRTHEDLDRVEDPASRSRWNQAIDRVVWHYELVRCSQMFSLRSPAALCKYICTRSKYRGPLIGQLRRPLSFTSLFFTWDAERMFTRIPTLPLVRASLVPFHKASAMFIDFSNC